MWFCDGLGISYFLLLYDNMSKTTRLPNGLKIKYKVKLKKGKKFDVDPFIVSSEKQMCYYSATKCLKWIILDTNNHEIHLNWAHMGKLVFLLWFSVYSFEDKDIRLSDVENVSMEFYDPAQGEKSEIIFAHWMNFGSDDDYTSVVLWSLATNATGGISYYQREDRNKVPYAEIRNSFNFMISR